MVYIDTLDESDIGQSVEQDCSQAQILQKSLCKGIAIRHLFFGPTGCKKDMGSKASITILFIDHCSAFRINVFAPDMVVVVAWDSDRPPMRVFELYTTYNFRFATSPRPRVTAIEGDGLQHKRFKQWIPQKDQ